MADRYVFADEAGNFDFSPKQDASKYFILCTVTLNSCELGNEVLELRRQLAWRGIHLETVFHANQDDYPIKKGLYSMIAGAGLRVDATILEKRKAQPHLHKEAYFYQMAWWLHFKWVAPLIVSQNDRLLVTASRLGETNKKRGLFYAAVLRVVQQVTPVADYRVAFWPHASDPCLQVADYCTWAIQRKWERGDASWHALIAPKIQTEKDIWAIGGKYYY
jgi:hypothetical protein